MAIQLPRLGALRAILHRSVRRTPVGDAGPSATSGEDASAEAEIGRRLLETSPDCVKVLDLDARLLSMNANGMCVMEIEDFGAACAGADWLGFWTGRPEGPAAHDAVAAAKAGGVGRFDGFCPTAKGTPKWWEVVVAPILGADGQVRKLLAVSRDVTERRRAEESLRRSEARFRELLQLTREGIVVHDSERILDANATFARLFGYEAPDEVIGLPILALVAPEAREEVLRRTRADYEQPYESVGLRRDGSTFPAEFCGHRIEHDGSRARLGAIWDITERKRQEDELRRAKEAAEQATRAKSRFLAAAGHDLRQPVTVLRMSLDMLAQRRQGLPDAKYLPRAERALGTLERALDEVMEVAKLEAGKLRPKPRSFALGELLDELREAWLPLAEGKGVTLRLRPCALPIRSDPAMLRRVLDNLVGNAIKYTERGGVLIGCRRRGDRLRIEVVDSGIGMPEDQIELAFQEFQRLYAASADGRESGAGGLGLGLSIVRRMADSLGHRVTARSTVGRGSRFTVEVPIAVPSRPAGTSPAPAEADATPCELT